MTNSRKPASTTPRPRLKIAIVGAGIGGCASAYFLSQTFADSELDLSVYERAGSAGGRIAELKFDGRDYEYGATILHSSNRYMKTFACSICGFKANERDSDSSSKSSYMGLYDSTGILVEQTGAWFGLLDLLAFARRYGLGQLYRLKSYVKTYIDTFCDVYKLQDRGVSFRSCAEFLHTLSPRFVELSQRSLHDLLLNDERFNPRLVDEIASIACLTNYGQSTQQLNAFCGLISLAGGFSGRLWSVNETNRAVARKILEKSGAKTFFNTTVRRISPDASRPDSLTSVTAESSDGTVTTESFDYVIVAFPVHESCEPKIDIDFAAARRLARLRMQQTNTYFVYGQLKLFPSLPLDKRIELFSVDPSLACRSIATQLPCDYSKKNDRDLFVKSALKLYKVFSEKNMSAGDWENVFERGYKLVKYMPWLAYPKYDAKIDFENLAPPIVLDDDDDDNNGANKKEKRRSRVFYLNALEWCASCMEMECVAARNITNLIAQKEDARVGGFFKPESNRRRRLKTYFLILSSLAVVFIANFVYIFYK